MSLILHLETATSVCSAALSRDEKVVAFYEENQGYQHASLLNSFILRCISEAGVLLPDIDAIAVSQGPGSYTGLRIGAATAKGLCYALEKPLIAIDTLQAMAHHLLLRETIGSDIILCPMIDARRMEVYNAFFDSRGEYLRQAKAEIITPASFDDILSKGSVLFFGDGMDKCRHLIAGSNSIFDDKTLPSALGMITLAHKSYNSGNFSDPAYFSPYYLKDFLDTRQPPKA